MVFDCFMYHNEEEVALFRLAELDEVVDRFVVVEGNKTFDGRPREAAFTEDIFGEYWDKVIHVWVDDIPDAAIGVAIDEHQRNAIMRGLTSAEEDDVVIISDVDEIPNRDAVRAYDSNLGIRSLRMIESCYWVNCRNTSEMRTVVKIMPKSSLTWWTPDMARRAETDTFGPAGWHFSSIGGVDMVSEKLRLFSAFHSIDIAPLIERTNVEESIENGIDIFGGPIQYSFVEIDETFPQNVQMLSAYIKH